MQYNRCHWAGDDPLLIAYHDLEWGVPVYDECILFEFLVLESMQAGLNWLTILKKRAHYRLVLDGFDPDRIALYDLEKQESLMGDPGVIRNRLKIRSIVSNAQAFVRMRETTGDNVAHLWRFVGGKPQKNHWITHAEIPANTSISDAMSRDLKKRGFKFMGSTICYAFMQAVGMVQDHTIQCARYQLLDALPE